MTLTLKQATRAFNRIWYGTLSELSAAEDADAAFDGGEFSGEFHANLQSAAYKRAADQVTEKTGYTIEDIMAESYRMDEEFVDRLMAAQKGRH